MCSYLVDVSLRTVQAKEALTLDAKDEDCWFYLPSGQGRFSTEFNASPPPLPPTFRPCSLLSPIAWRAGFDGYATPAPPIAPYR